ncbi:hypothetical protein [Stenotrophomonas sp. AS1]|uniref:hypothetical protein n=1 Tax=Stenotrophomonas sp. AS1 TaxID=3029188 RepID=UPI003B7EDA18
MKRLGYCILFVAISGCAAVLGGGEPFLPLLNPPPPGQEEVYLTAALGGVPVIERGCVRIASPAGDRSRTVLWHRGTELGKDSQGYYLLNARTGTRYRFGTVIAFGGGEMPADWAAQSYPEAVRRCGPPYASGWLPK